MQTKEKTVAVAVSKTRLWWTGFYNGVRYDADRGSHRTAKDFANYIVAVAHGTSDPIYKVKVVA